MLDGEGRKIKEAQTVIASCQMNLYLECCGSDAQISKERESRNVLGEYLQSGTEKSGKLIFWGNAHRVEMPASLVFYIP